MVSLQTVSQSNAHVAALPRSLVALFIGATSGIGQSTLKQLAQHATAPRIYTVARPGAVDAHEKLLASLRNSYPSATFNLITADVSLISEVDKVAQAVKDKETKLDLLVTSTGYMPFDGRQETTEGHDPSMTTRYYSRQRAVELLLPLLNAAPSPRVVHVLAGGMEKPLNEADLDLKDPANFSTWNANYHAATMSTLGLEHVAGDHPHLSLVHWLPGPVQTRGLTRLRTFGLDPPGARDEDEAGAICLFISTNDRYAIDGGLVPIPEGLSTAKRSGGGIFILDPDGETTDNEGVLADMRARGVNETVWKFTQDVFSRVTAH